MLFRCLIVFCVCVAPALHDIFHTPMARYSLFVLKVPLNNSQLTNDQRCALIGGAVRRALRPKKYCCFRKHGQKNRVGRSVFFYNGAYKYTKLLHTFLSLLSSSYIVL